MTDPATQAAYAARQADRRVSEMPNVVLGGQRIGVCFDCDARFDYGRGCDVMNMDPCPECGGRNWTKWGYRYNGDEIRRDEAWDRYDPPEDDDRELVTDGGVDHPGSERSEVLVSTNADTRNQSGRYHTDEGCHRVDLGTMREVQLQRATDEMGLDECGHCAGEVDRSHTGEKLAYKLEAMDA